MSAPYRADTADLLPFPLGHLSEVTAHPAGADPVILDVETGSLEVTFSEDWAPYAQVKLSVPAADAALLDTLDPRIGCRIKVSAGYRYPDGRADLQPLADVGLRERPVRRPQNTVALAAASDEALTQDNRIMFYQPAMPRTGVMDAAAWLIRQAVAPAVPRFDSDFIYGIRGAGLADMEVELGADYWSLLDDVAARTQVRIWCDEARVWRITLRPDGVADAPALALTVGEAGTIITSEAGLDREEWYNAVLIRYRWRDAAGQDHEMAGRARLWEGPLSVSAAGAKVYLEEYERRASQLAADTAAEARLRNLVTRGRSLTVRAAAAYWLRPGMTVSVQLPTGAAEKHLVQAVTFYPHSGEMELVTRQPVNVNIKSGE